MVINMPTELTVSFSGMDCLISFLKNFKTKNNIIADKSTRYHTNKPSLKDINLPKTPVKPANITAMCKRKYDFFMKMSVFLFYS